jgi:protein-S-isoprenylcysteine O-methyltransferase Ste14
VPRVDAWIGLAVLTAATAAPTVLFWHPRRAYVSGKDVRLPSHAGFRRIDRWMRAVTLLIGGVALFSRHRALLEWHHSSLLVFVGIVVVAAGLLLLVAAKRALGLNYSPCFDSYAPFRVVHWGPYRYLRHPMYVAYVLMWTGTCLMTGTAWLVVTWAVGLRWYCEAAGIEEGELARRFPGYANYMARAWRGLPRFTAPESEAWDPPPNFAADIPVSIPSPPSGLARAPSTSDAA